MAKTNDVLTTGEVADICKVAPRTVSKWFDSGRLGGYRIPGSKDRRIPRAELLKFMKEHGIPLNGFGYDKPRALIVRSPNSNNTHFQKILAENRFEVQLAQSLFAAGVLAERHKPQLIIWEVEADPQKRKEIPKDIRDIAQMCNAKVLAVTSTEQQYQELKDSGFDVCLTEPVNEAHLLAVMQELAGINP